MSEVSLRPTIQALERLSEHIADGDVVPFVGAGFSIDTEKNTAPTLVRRLLLRLVALTNVREGRLAERALVSEITKVFGLQGDETAEFPFTTKDVTTLKDRYYETNEWFCTAFAQILGKWVEPSDTAPRDEADAKVVAADIANEERRLAGTIRIDSEPLAIVLQNKALLEKDLPLLVRLIRSAASDRYSLLRAAGKALFLDTMGFRDSEIMGGTPKETDIGVVAGSYVRRLRPRHHVFARLTREGLCTTLVTFNYDMLLEGGLRLAGLCEIMPPQEARRLPLTDFENYARITSPLSFFGKGKEHRTPVLVKVHGCAEAYRDCAYQTLSSLQQSLRSMVFTYREIQNWREDSWAADYLRTLLRTRVVVFVGYSLADPVIHDTFRTVYEEMAREHERALRVAREHQEEAAARGEVEATCGAVEAPGSAPAFFFAPESEKHQFHGREILNAASAAVGAPRQEGAHENRITFWFSHEWHFPNLDEVLVWLFHRTHRRIQERCLDTDLRRTISMLLSPQPETRLAQLRTHFGDLCARELEIAEGWETPSAAAEPDAKPRELPLDQQNRFFFRRLTSFTSFGNALLREFAMIELLQQRGQTSANVVELRKVAWHFPANQDSRWTSWTAVVEMAIRRMVARVHGVAGLVHNDLVWSVDAPGPTVMFRNDDKAPQALTICLAGFDSEAAFQRVPGNPVRHCFWHLSVGHFLHVPEHPHEPRVSANRVILTAPSARLLFRWASAASDAELDLAEARRCLGLPPRRQIQAQSNQTSDGTHLDTHP